jgi:hypothetical protein
MRHVKSERLKKYESELNDLEQWLKLGLVPKKDLEKHKNEIKVVLDKIEEEKERLLTLKESGESEEFIIPKRNAVRAGYNESPSIPDIDVSDTVIEEDPDLESETEGTDSDTSIDDRGETQEDDDDDRKSKSDSDDEDESYFSDRNRWRRGGIVDPEADEW